VTNQTECSATKITPSYYNTSCPLHMAISGQRRPLRKVEPNNYRSNLYL